MCDSEGEIKKKEVVLSSQLRPKAFNFISTKAQKAKAFKIKQKLLKIWNKALFMLFHMKLKLLQISQTTWSMEIP